MLACIGIEHVYTHVGRLVLHRSVRHGRFLFGLATLLHLDRMLGELVAVFRERAWFVAVPQSSRVVRTFVPTEISSKIQIS